MVRGIKLHTFILIHIKINLQQTGKLSTHVSAGAGEYVKFTLKYIIVEGFQKM
jgi:hypothetical protein